MSLQARVRWADRKSFIYLTIDVANCDQPNIKVEPNHFSMSNDNYGVFFPFFAAVDPEKTVTMIQPTCIELKIYKKTEQKWSSLTNQGKQHWISVDWNKWVEDSSESDLEGGFDDEDFNNNFRINDQLDDSESSESEKYVLDADTKEYENE